MVAAIGHILTPAEILARLLTVDGAGSGLDADKVDGLDSTTLLGSIAGRVAKTANYTVVAGDRGYVIDCTSGTFTLSLTAAATLGAAFSFTVVNTGSGLITIDPNGSETIRTPSGSGTTAVLAQGQALTVICDGSGFSCIAVAVPPGAAGRLAKTGTYTVVAADRGMVIDCTSGTFSVNLTAAATLASGFNVYIYNSGSGTITIDPNSSETVRDPSGSATTKTLAQGAGVLLLCDGSGFLVIAAAASSSASTGTLGALDTASPVSVTTGTTITSSGRNKTHVCTGTSADYNVTLDTSSGWSAGDVIAFEMDPALTKIVSIVSSANIDGNSPRRMWANETCILRWDGSTWRKIAGKTIPMVCKLTPAGTQTITNNSGGQLLTLDTATIDPAVMADTANSKVLIRREGNYRVTANFRLTANANDITDARIYLQKNSTTIIDESDDAMTSNTGYLQVKLGSIFNVSASDTLRVLVDQVSTANRATDGPVGPYCAFLNVEEIPQW